MYLVPHRSQSGDFRKYASRIDAYSRVTVTEQYGTVRDERNAQSRKNGAPRLFLKKILRVSLISHHVLKTDEQSHVGVLYTSWIMAVIYCRSTIVKFSLLGWRYLTQMNWQPGQGQSKSGQSQLSDNHVIGVHTPVTPQPPQQAVRLHISADSLASPRSSLLISHSRHVPSSFKTCTLAKPLSLLCCPSKPPTSKSPLWPTSTKTPVKIEPYTASSQRTSACGTNASQK